MDDAWGPQDLGGNAGGGGAAVILPGSGEYVAQHAHDKGWENLRVLGGAQAPEELQEEVVSACHADGVKVQCLPGDYQGFSNRPMRSVMWAGVSGISRGGGH